MKVVINACHGGFSLSPEGQAAYLARRHGKQAFFYEHARTSDGRPDFDNYVKSADPRKAFMTVTATEDFGATATKDQLYPESEEGERFYDREIKRDDPDLIAVVEELGSKANGSYAKLQVVEIPDGVEWQIEEYDGLEWVAEKHRTWA